jgi:hypothetical protein
MFKRTVLPSDNIALRNTYIKMMDHKSVAIVDVAKEITELSHQEKMTLTPINGDINRDFTTESDVQHGLYKLLLITEPLILNDENTLKAINAGLVNTFGQMLIFQSQNLMNIKRNFHKLSDSS